jgi:transcriptional regulator with XRE-family HTH domain
MHQHDVLDRIAANVRIVRECRGLSREELAASSEVDAQMIKRIEGARANPALVVLSRLAAALTISLSLVLSGDASADAGRMLHTGDASEAFEAEAVGDTITSLRKHRRLSRRALARLVDIRTVTLSRYEAATTDARILAVEPIARALGLETDDFVRHVELTQQQNSRGRGGVHAPMTGVQCHLVTAGEMSELWEWRFAPATRYSPEPAVVVSEEIATAIRGEVSVETNGEVHKLRRGGSVALTAGLPRTFVNRSRTTARMLVFQVRK